MPAQQQYLPTHEVNLSDVWASFDAGTTYEHVQGVSGVVGTTGATPTETVEAFERSANRAGVAPLGSIACTLAAGAWARPVMKKLWEARQAGTSFKWRFQSPAKVLYSEESLAKAAITKATGAVTFTDQASKLNPKKIFNDMKSVGPGVVIGIADTAIYYVVDTIEPGDNGTPAITVRPKPSADVAASDFSIFIPGLKLELDGKITDGMGFDASLGGSIGTEFTVTPDVHIPFFTLIGHPNSS